jgi:hypothetical protein
VEGNQVTVSTVKFNFRPVEPYTMESIIIVIVTKNFTYIIGRDFHAVEERD